MLEQGISLLGAAMILFAYAGQQMQKMRPTGLTYIVLNLVGSLILAVIALRVRQMGLVLLEGVWALISAVALVRSLRKS